MTTNSRSKPVRPAVVHRRECPCMVCRMARGRSDAASQRGQDWRDPIAPFNHPQSARRIIAICVAGIVILLALLRCFPYSSG